MRIEALLFLQKCLASHPPATFQPYLASLLPPIVALAGDRYYKTVAEALRVLSEVVRLLRPSPPAAPGFDYASLVPPVYAVVEKRLQAQDQDQEVKECAITCMGLLVFHLADHPSVNLPQVLPLLLERMRNEITRVTAVKTFALLASQTQLDIKLTTVLQPTVAELCTFLRKSNRPLRQASLTALNTIISNHGGALSDGDVSAAVTELSALIADSDLHVASLALGLGKAIATAKPSSMAEPLKEIALPKALVLLQSSLLQGVALRGVLAFLAELVGQRLAPLPFDALMAQLLALPNQSSLNRHSLVALSQAVAACCHRADAADAGKMISSFTAQLTAANGTSVLALYCLGEIGRLLDLSSSQATLLPAILSGFDAPDEETRAAASFALGSIASGNLAAFVPRILQLVDEASAHDYLLLHALKETIGSGGSALGTFAPQLLPKLLAFAERDEEGVRNVVAECLGRLTAVSPDVVVPKMTELLTSDNAATRATVISSLRTAIIEIGAAPLPPSLQASLPSFLRLLEDPDLRVRHGAVLTLNGLSHGKPSAVREALPSLLPMLYAETAKKPELRHEVNLGPFKHTVDDGLEIRKAAFECMETLLARCADRLELVDFITHLMQGLKDEDDIQLLAHRMVVTLAGHPAAAPIVVASLETMCDGLRATLVRQLKDNAVKQQIDRHAELVRSAMRACRALERMPDSEGVAKFAELCRVTLRGEKLRDRYAAVCAEEEAVTKGGDE